MTAVRFSLIAALFTVGICPAGAIDLPDRRDPREPTLTDALNAAIIGKRPLDDISISARWTGVAALTVYGEGLGTLDGKEHFLIEREQFISLLKLLRKANFSTLPEKFGRTDSEKARRTIGQLTLQVGKQFQHAVTQNDGQVYEELEKLTQQIIAAAKPTEQNRVATANVGEGIELLAKGRLPPRALVLSLSISPANGADGLRLSLAGRKLSVRTIDNRGALGQEQSRLLPQAEWNALLATLVEQQVATLPPVFQHDQSTSLIFGVLGKTVRIYARSKPQETNAQEDQASRDRFLKLLEQLKSLAKT